MFDNSLSDWDALVALSGSELASAIAENHTALMARECRVLELAAAWADLHDQQDRELEYSPLIERSCVWGGAGTPAVSEFCATELGALQGTGVLAAQCLIADALDLRYRLPRLWAQVKAGQVRAWQARKVAEQTRRLSWEACTDLDTQLSGFLAMMPWGRFQRMLTAAIIDADPALAAERDQRARQARDVWACDSDDGLKTIIAKAASGDAVWFMATVSRIAEILAAEGDTDPVGLRRSRAIGILAQPALALELLVRHRHDPEPSAQSAEPVAEEGLDESADQTESVHQSLKVDPPTPARTKAAAPRVVLHFHLSDAAVRAGHGMVRPEHGDPLSLGQLREWLAGTGCRVTVRPVWDPAVVAPVDEYEIPHRVRDAVRLRNLADVFPYGSCTSATMDLDHTRPYVPMDEGGPPGQTGPAKLGPMTRHHHRAVTQGRWRKAQPSPGQFVFRSPNGHIFLVTGHGTQPLGTTDFAKSVWRAASHAAST